MNIPVRPLASIIKVCLLSSIFVPASLHGVAAAQNTPATCEEELSFTFWGSPQEKRAVDDMLTSFNESHPGITVRGQHVPTDYQVKLNTMIAANTPPAAGYLEADVALAWAEEGILLDLTSYFEEDLAAADRLEGTLFEINDRIFGGLDGS